MTHAYLAFLCSNGPSNISDFSVIKIIKDYCLQYFKVQKYQLMENQVYLMWYGLKMP